MKFYNCHHGKQGSDHYNCVDEMSENEEKIITVKNCISKYNSVSGLKPNNSNSSGVTITNQEITKEESTSEITKKETTESKNQF